MRKKIPYFDFESSFKSRGKEATEWSNHWTEYAHGQWVQKERIDCNRFVNFELKV